MKFIISFIAFTLITLPSNAYSKEYIFGLVPQQSASKLAENWVPIFDYLSKQTGDTYIFATASDIPTFEKRVKSGEYDIAYMNPYHYTVFHDSTGYLPLLKQKNKRIQGVLVVNEGSPIKSLEDLKNNEQVLDIAFPSPAAFAATIIPQAQLNKLGINYNPVYVSSHDSVYLNVSNQFFPLGGGINRTLNNTKDEVNDSLIVLWESVKYTPHAFAYHPRVELDAIERLQKAFLEMPNSSEGKALLQKINIPSFEIAQDSDWDDVRSLDIQLLE